MEETMRKVSRSSLCLLALMVVCCPVKAFEVAKDGKPTCSIVISPMATPSVRLAAEELTAYVEKISGVVLSTKTELSGKSYQQQPSVRHKTDFTWKFNPKKSYSSIWEKKPAAYDKNKNGAIVIGSLENLSSIPRSIKKRLEKCDNDEAFYIKTDGCNIFVIGKKPIGALYGTYTLLEKYMGVRWLHPGELGEHCSKTATISLSKIDDFQKPDMATRVQRGGTVSHAYDVIIWRARNKMQIRHIQPHRWFGRGGCSKERAEFLSQALNIAGPSRGGHSIWEQTVPVELFDKHPEYFPLKDGKRKRGTKSANSMQRCVSNPEVVKLVSEYALKWCDANPKNSFTLDACDSRNTWCDCEKCHAMGTVDGKFKITNLYHAFASQVENYVLKRNPEANLQIYFYIDKCYPPDDKNVKYDGKNFCGLYCTCWPYARCYAHDLTDPKCVQNKKCLKNMKEILKVCPRLYTYEYLCVSNIPYAPVWKTISHDIKKLKKIGYEGYMDIVNPSRWRSRWLSLYLGVKLHWDIEQDPYKLRRDAYAKYYGPAAQVMTKYHDLRLKLWKNAPGHAFYGGPQRQAYCLTVPGAEKKLRGYLAEAEKLAAEDKKVRARIALDQKFLNEFWKPPADKLKERFSAEKQILPQRTKEKIIIDGDLSENSWVNARPVTGFLKLNTTQEPAEESDFRIAYDKDNLYIGFTAMNDKAWSQVVAKEKKRDGKGIWSDDHIELEFAPPNADGRFYHLVINTNGVIYDSVMVGSDIDKSFDSKADVKVKKLEDRFTYEIRLPLAPMKGDVSPGKVWGIYALRTSRNLQPPTTKETSSLDGNYPHRVMEFRKATFGDNAVKNGNFSDTTEKKKATTE